MDFNLSKAKPVLLYVSSAGFLYVSTILTGDPSRHDRHLVT